MISQVASAKGLQKFNINSPNLFQDTEEKTHNNDREFRRKNKTIANFKSLQTNVSQ